MQPKERTTDELYAELAALRELELAVRFLEERAMIYRPLMLTVVPAHIREAIARVDSALKVLAGL